MNIKYNKHNESSPKNFYWVFAVCRHPHKYTATFFYLILPMPPYSKFTYILQKKESVDQKKLTNSVVSWHAFV